MILKYIEQREQTGTRIGHRRALACVFRPLCSRCSVYFKDTYAPGDDSHDDEFARLLEIPRAAYKHVWQLTTVVLAPINTEALRPQTLCELGSCYAAGVSTHVGTYLATLFAPTPCTMLSVSSRIGLNTFAAGFSSSKRMLLVPKKLARHATQTRRRCLI